MRFTFVAESACMNVFLKKEYKYSSFKSVSYIFMHRKTQVGLGYYATYIYGCTLRHSVAQLPAVLQLLWVFNNAKLFRTEQKDYATSWLHWFLKVTAFFITTGEKDIHSHYFIVQGVPKNLKNYWKWSIVRISMPSTKLNPRVDKA